MVKRLLCALLALLTAAGIFAACSAPAEEAAGETAAAESDAPVTGETKPVPNVPDGLVFDGRVFNLLSSQEYYCLNFTEEMSGDVLNDAVYSTRRNIEERLDVTVTETPSPFWEMTNTVNKLVKSGDGTYDAVSHMDRYLLDLTMEGNFLAYDTLEYVDLDAVYWIPAMTGAVSVAGRHFMAVNSYNLRAYYLVMCLLMNKNLAESLNIGMPYDIVRDGGWTRELTETYAAAAASDLNGDGAMDKEDRWGFHWEIHWGAVNTALIAGHTNLIEKDADGLLYNSAPSNERAADIIASVYAMMHEKDYVFVSRLAGEMDIMAENTKIFNEGRSLFMESYLNVTGDLRAMEDNYSVLPVPKYDEAQEDYFARGYGANYSMVFVTCLDPSFAGAVLESLSCEAWNMILPAYIQDTLQGKYTRDAESEEMVSLLLGARDYSIAETFVFLSYGDGAFLELMSEKSLTTASWLAETEPEVQKKIDAINLYFGNS